MKKNQKLLWIKELHEFNKKTDEEIATMLDIDISEVKSYISELNGGGVTMKIDEVKADTPIETEEEPKSEKISNRDLVKKLYLEENKNYEEISKELGLSLSTIKLYITQGGYNKNPRRKRRSRTPKEPVAEIVEEEEPATKNIERDEKPYMDIGDGYVVYEGRLMKKLTKEEFVKAMLEDQKKRKNK